MTRQGKAKHSTVMCSLTVKEVIHYYVNNGSDVHASCVDASKAFDRVRHDKLFQLLIEREIPAIALRALLDVYQRQVMRTVWKGELSSQFNTTNGIRQGGVVSPVLFCIYMDVLLLKLEAEALFTFSRLKVENEAFFSFDLDVAWSNAMASISSVFPVLSA